MSLVKIHFKTHQFPVTTIARIVDRNTVHFGLSWLCTETNTEFHFEQLISLPTGGMAICRPPVSLPDFERSAGGISWPVRIKSSLLLCGPTQQLNWIGLHSTLTVKVMH